MRLPIGIQSFRKIIEGGYVYADKTKVIHRLIQEGSYYFLSRPRRFGKSLLIDTMNELFLGHRELFAGLYIASKEANYDFPRYPVIRLDLTQFDITSPETVKSGLTKELNKIAENESIILKGDNPTEQFSELIAAMAKKQGNRVVVLIDEYDKPVIDHIHDPEKARINREVLGNFYGVLKGQDANLQFAFLTGVSKFTKLSVFSKSNNLNDITLRVPYANICGITEYEFENLFGNEIDNEIKSEVFDWYDGYSWDGETRVFNPFSLLNYLNDREFNPYWFNSGIPSFLAPAFIAEPFEYVNIQSELISESMLDSHNIEDAPLISLLFQTGFLTVKAANRNARPPLYSLGFPNIEVSNSISELFLMSGSGLENPYNNTFITCMEKALDEGDYKEISAALQSLYASIPYELHIGAEAFYHAIFLAVMQFLNFRVQGEVSVAKGRIDGVLERPNRKVYIIEFKYTKDESKLDDALKEALTQIDNREYHSRYEIPGREVIKLAIAVATRGKVKAQLCDNSKICAD
ncbi:MAG: ATP-binding protein [Lachnospiraceae bacterium]|jgi:hypothetical protein|nr:ATP-binding protein [Lachnospiraceae bacterium]